MNRVVQYYRSNAVSRGHLWELDTAACTRLFEAACSYCGMARSMRLSFHTHYYEYNGIDRVTNAGGYTEDNSASCCKHCNRMKGALGVSEFLQHVAKIAAHTEARTFKQGRRQ